MRRRSRCAGAFRDPEGMFRVIGKVSRGVNAGGLLRYLYGPGKANEHTDPHLVAGFGDPRELEPDLRPDGSRDLRRLSGLLSQPLALDPLCGCDKPVWHCSVRAPGGGRTVTIRVCGGSRSGTPRITSTSPQRWPARTAAGSRPGTTSTGCGKP